MFATYITPFGRVFSSFFFESLNGFSEVAFIVSLHFCSLHFRGYVLIFDVVA